MIDGKINGAIILNITNHRLGIMSSLGILIGKKVKNNLSFRVQGRLGGTYDAFTPDNLKEIEDYVIKKIELCGIFMSIQNSCRSIVNVERFVQLVAGEQIKDGTFTGLSKRIYDKSGTNILSTESYYHFSPEDHQDASFIDLVDAALLREAKEK